MIVLWTEEAEEKLGEVIYYLKSNWTTREVERFKTAVDKVINVISKHPRLYRCSTKKGIREAVVTKHNLLLYRIRRTHIEVLTLFDTRQHPRKKFRK